MASSEKGQPAGKDNSGSGEFIRRFKMNPFLFIGTVVILVIVIVAFVLVPAIVPSAGGPSEDLNFGYYNKIPINYVRGNHFYQVQSTLAQNWQSQIDESNSLDITYRIWRGAFEEAVVRIGILEEMKRAGYTAPQSEVNREMALLPQFRENGRFSVTKYRQMDKTTELTLWRQTQEDMAVRQYVSDMTGLSISSREADFMGSMAGPRRSFEMAAFPLSSYPDGEVLAYGEENPDLFRTARLSVITVGSGEREARQILGSIEDGTLTFEDAAKANSRDGYAERGGDMGIKMAYELATEIPDPGERETVVGLAGGAYSPIVKTPGGWSFFRAEEAPRPANFSDPAVLEKVRSYIISFERGRAEDWLLGEANRFIEEVRAAGFEAACLDRHIPIKSFGPLAVNYGDAPFFAPLSSFGVAELGSAREAGYAGTNEIFWRTAFTTPSHSPSSPLILGDNAVVLFPGEEVPADETDMEDIKNYYSVSMSRFTEEALRFYFLTNPKLEDGFNGAFRRYFLPAFN
ncbi:MAG: SurA N-terminal domain-containing protein [Treponema sp.]|jgi:hypothetical protein|nr:SurA N-terminal domain-containing protein [Treponema sp.]